MEPDIVLVIDADGRVGGLATDELDLYALGRLRACRVSHVEFSEAHQGWIARVFTEDGSLDSPAFSRRADALAWERWWLGERLAAGISLTRAA